MRSLIDIIIVPGTKDPEFKLNSGSLVFAFHIFVAIINPVDQLSFARDKSFLESK